MKWIGFFMRVLIFVAFVSLIGYKIGAYNAIAIFMAACLGTSWVCVAIHFLVKD